MHFDPPKIGPDPQVGWKSCWFLPPGNLCAVCKLSPSTKPASLVFIIATVINPKVKSRGLGDMICELSNIVVMGA